MSVPMMSSVLGGAYLLVVIARQLFFGLWVFGRKKRSFNANSMKKIAFGEEFGKALYYNIKQHPFRLNHQIFTMDLFSLPSLKLTVRTCKDASLNLKGKYSTQLNPYFSGGFAVSFREGILEDHPRTCKWLRSPPFM